MTHRPSTRLNSRAWATGSAGAAPIRRRASGSHPHQAAAASGGADDHGHDQGAERRGDQQAEQADDQAAEAPVASTSRTARRRLSPDPPGQPVSPAIIGGRIGSADGHRLGHVIEADAAR